jgi:uncharacterized cupredoxin-like copper-binding protein
MISSRFATGVLAVIMIPALALFAARAYASSLDDEEAVPLTSTAPVQALDVVASDFKFEPRALTIGAGPASFTIRNQGVIDHDYVIWDDRRQVLAGSEVLGPGRTGTFDATLSAGTYRVVCTVPGHLEVGMVGELVVTQ